MKKLILLSLIFLFTSTFAQKFTIKKGQETAENAGKFTVSNYLGSDESFVYLSITSAISHGAYGNKIQKLDRKTLSIVDTKILGSTANVFLKSNKILFFQTLNENKERSLVLKIYKTPSIELEKEEVIISKFPLVTPDYKQGISFDFIFSENNSKMAVISKITQYKKPYVIAFNVDIYDLTTFKKIETKSIPNQFEKLNIKSLSFALDNSGSFYYLINYYREKDPNRETRETSLGSINPNSTTINKIQIQKNDKLFENGEIKLFGDKLIFSGMFMDTINKFEKNANGGVFMYIIDSKTNQVKNYNFNYFPVKVSAKLNYRQDNESPNPICKSLNLDHILALNNSYYLIESHSFRTMVYDNFGGSPSSMAPKDRDKEIIVSKFSNTGELEWMNIIPRHTSNIMNGHNYIIKDDKIYFFYFDHHKNLEKNQVDNYDMLEMELTSSVHGSVLVYTSIDKTGTLERNTILTNEDWYYLPEVNGHLSTNGNGIILKMTNEKIDRYDLFEFK